MASGSFVLIVVVTAKRVKIERQDDGLFNLFPVMVSKGRFSYGGKVYGK